MPVPLVSLIGVLLSLDVDARFVGTLLCIVVDGTAGEDTRGSAGPSPGNDVARTPAASSIPAGAEAGTARADHDSQATATFSNTLGPGTEVGRVETSIRLFDDLYPHPGRTFEVFRPAPGHGDPPQVWARDGPSRGAVPWLERRFVNLTLRLERRLFLDPDLRHIGDEDVQGHGYLAESQRQELNLRLFGLVRSEITDMARDEFDSVSNDVRETFLENPFFQIFSVDSSHRRPTELDGSAAPLPVGNGATSVSVVGPRHNSVQGWVETLAHAASEVVPGEIDFTSSVSLHRYRFGAELQPLLYRDLPTPLRGLTIKASREYQDYLGDPEVVDRVGCWIDCFVTRYSHGKLFLEHARSRDDQTTRLGFLWICRL
jgi:hypothetical protein